MTDFWISSGHHLLDRDEGGGLLVTDEFLKVYLARPELVPPREACVAEHTLYNVLLADPRRPISAGEIAAIVDPDARENWRLLLAFRGASDRCALPWWSCLAVRRFRTLSAVRTGA